MLRNWMYDVIHIATRGGRYIVYIVLNVINIAQRGGRYIVYIVLNEIRKEKLPHSAKLDATLIFPNQNHRTLYLRSSSDLVDV